MMLAAAVSLKSHPLSHLARPLPPLPQVTDQCLAAFLGLPRLQRLHLEHCVELTDAGMAALQGGWRQLVTSLRADAPITDRLG